MRDTLAALIERVEQATAEQQGEVMREAVVCLTYALIIPAETCARAMILIAAEAYESAARVLVPEGWGFSVARSEGGRCAATIDWGDKRRASVRDAATPALALTAAALRARMEDGR